MGLYLAAVEKRRQEEPREKGACVSHHKTTRTREMAVCRLQRREKPADVRGKRHCCHSGVTVVPVLALWSLQSVWSPQAPALSEALSHAGKASSTKHWTENFIKAQSSSGKPGKILALRPNNPPLF